MSVSFAELKQRTRIEDVVSMLGLVMTKKDDQWRGPCPACNSGGNRALAVNTSRGGFYCFASNGQAKGDLIALYAHIKGVSDKQAAEAIATQTKFAGNGGQVHRAPTVPQAPRSSGFDPEKYLGSLEPEHTDLNVLGITPDTFRAYRSGYAKGGVHRGKLALALSDPQGNILGFAGYDLKTAALTFPPNINVQDIIFGADKAEGDVRLVHSLLTVLEAHEMDERAVCFLTEGVEPIQLERLASVLDLKQAKLFL